MCPDIINEGRISAFQYMIVLLCGLVMLIDGFDTQAISYMAPLMAKEWGISQMLLGPIFASALVGLMVGYLALAPLSDRFGHRRMLIASTIFFALFTGVTIFATNVTELIVLRFLTGAGLGAAIPSAVALSSEYTPKRLRATFVLAIYCGFSLGFVVAGVAAAWLLIPFGWRSLLWIGAGFPLALSVILLVLLPDSLDQLVRAGAKPDQIWIILQRIDSRLAGTPMPAGFTTDQEEKLSAVWKRFQGRPNCRYAVAVVCLRSQPWRILCAADLAAHHSDRPLLFTHDGRHGNKPDNDGRHYRCIHCRPRHGSGRSIRIAVVPLSRRCRVRGVDRHHA